ncbi:hypothetical protein [Novilysobacter erysipheiresistens]|uniref:Uncharacterized protein n=1 Tax=Novilysobacter erysipheiresistens TaxID=1749332 RepID=A0ABU7YVX1_9GAMM
MSQDLLSLSLVDEDITAIGASLTDIESRLAGRLVALDNDSRRQITKMGNKSEAFVRQTLMVLEQNPDVVPAALRLEEAQADLRAVDALRPVLARLQRLAERVADSEMALGSDAMNTALEGYALLKVTGRNKGLEALSEALAERFSRSSSAPEPVPAQ